MKVIRISREVILVVSEEDLHMMKCKDSVAISEYPLKEVTYHYKQKTLRRPKP